MIAPHDNPNRQWKHASFEEKKQKKTKHDYFSALVDSVFVELHLIFSSSLLKR